MRGLQQGRKGQASHNGDERKSLITFEILLKLAGTLPRGTRDEKLPHLISGRDALKGLQACEGVQGKHGNGCQSLFLHEEGKAYIAVDVKIAIPAQAPCVSELLEYRHTYPCLEAKEMIHLDDSS